MISQHTGHGAVLAACLLALAGCGDDSAPTTDSGVGDTGTSDTGAADTGTGDTATGDTGTGDTGTGDSGTGDSGTGDSGTTPTDAFVRVAHLVANGPAVRVCAEVKVGGTVINTVGPLPPRGDGSDPGIPFRGVSQYLTFPVGVDYTVSAYDLADIDGFTTEHCPTAADGVTPVVSADVPAAALTAGHYYTVAATGLMADAGGALPSRCGATFDQPCPDALTAQLQLFEDDGAPAAGKVAIRVIQGIPNLPSLDICYDTATTTDGGMPAPAGSPTLIAGDVSPTTASAYMDMDPITDGFITIHIHDAAGPCLPGMPMLAAVPVPFPDPVGTAMIPGSTKTFDADGVVTIFGSGYAPAPLGASAPDGTAFIPMLDEIPPS